jgi:hypothetical protein
MATWKKVLTEGDVGSGMSFTGTDGSIVKISSNTLVESTALNVGTTGVVQQESGVYRYEPKAATLVGRQLCTSSTSNGVPNHDEAHSATGDIVQIECSASENLSKGFIYISRGTDGDGLFSLDLANNNAASTAVNMLFYCNKNQSSATPTLYIKAVALVPQSSIGNLDTTTGSPSGSGGTASGVPLYMGTNGKFEVNVPTTATHYVRHVGYLMERDVSISGTNFCKVYFCPSQDYILLE